MSTLLSLLAAINIGATDANQVAADIAWVAKGSFCEPETVLPLPDNTLLVSNVCDFRQQGNGFLTLLDADGKVLDWQIVDGLDAPLGMGLLDGTLYLLDNNQLKTFKWPGYEPLKSVDLDTSVANDLTVTPQGVIYITDTAKHRVIRRLPDGSQSVLTGEARFKNANGIAISEDHLYVGGERLWRIGLLDGSVETVGPEWITDIDGIEFEADGTIQITPVAGPLIRYRNDSEIYVITGPGISSANHGYAENLRLALIPTGFDNTVIAIRISD